MLIIKDKKQIKTKPIPITLYDYQQIAFNKTIKALRVCGRALIVMATGLGKTFTSARIVEYFITQHISKSAKVLFLCDKNNILKQGHKNYKKILGNQYTYANFFGKTKGRSKKFTPENCNFVFATFQSKPHKYFKTDHFDFIVVDESHHSKAKTYDQVLNYFTPTYKLGMTATPDREDEQDIRQIFGKEIVNYELSEAIAREWVTPIEYKILSDGIDDDILESLVNDVLAEKIRITEKQLNEKLFINMRTEVQVKHILQYTAERNLKAIVFCKNIAHMEHVANILPDCVSVHSEQSDVLNDFAIAQYESGQVRHILAVEMFNEGIDLPDTDVLVFLRGTDSYRIWAQQLGRGLRKYPDKDKVIVLDFVANIERIQNVRKLSLEIERFRKKSGKLDDLNTTPALHIEGNGYIFDFDEKIVSVLSMLEYMVHAETIPQGWMSLDSIEKSDFVLTSKLTIQKFVEPFRKTNPEWFKLFFIKSISDYNEYYHPDLIDILIKEFGKSVRIKAPIGWETANSLKKKKIVKSYESVVNFVSQFRKSNPEWFKIYWKINDFFEHYHPKLILKIRKYFKNISESVLDIHWKNKTQINRNIGFYEPQFSSFVEPFRKTNPEWFRISFNKKNRKFEYYHPDLIKKIKEFIVIRGSVAPIGWETVGSLKIKKISTNHSITRFVSQFRKSNPEWFVYYLNLKNNKKFEYIHPDLVQKIKDHFSKKIN